MIDLFDYIMEYIERNKEKESFKIEIKKSDFGMIKPSSFTMEVMTKEVEEANKRLNIDIKIYIYDDIKNNKLILDIRRE